MIFVAAAVLIVAVGVPVAAGVPHGSSKGHAKSGSQSRTTTPKTSKVSVSSRIAPRAGGYFKTLPPGAALPTGAECAARVRRSDWEPRPGNRTANDKIVPQPVALPDNPAFDETWQRKYKTRIDGDFSGTTDEIIQWASCKWGISDDLTRARAVQESSWQQSKVGDYEARTNGHCAKDFSSGSAVCPTSFGILQSKWYFRPGVYPDTRLSTAFNIDSVLAETRGCLDGLEWFGPQSRGDVWGCVGLWFSGEWDQNDASYIAHVRAIYSEKPWLSWKG